MAPLKNISPLAELVAGSQLRAVRQVESKLRRTLAAVAVVAAVAAAAVAQPSGCWLVAVRLVAWNFVG